MNKKQKRVLIAAFVIILLMGLFPPYSARIPVSFQSSNYITEDLGYSFILANAPTSSGFRETAGDVNFGKLFLQWMVVGIGAAGMYFFMRETETGKKPEEQPPARP